MAEEEADVPQTVYADPEEPEIVMVVSYPPNATAETIARQLRDYPGEGQPFYAFTNTAIPSDVAANPAANFDGAPVITSSIAENVALINGMLLDSSLQTFPNLKVYVAS